MVGELHLLPKQDRFMMSNQPVDLFAKNRRINYMKLNLDFNAIMFYNIIGLFGNDYKMKFIVTKFKAD